VVVGTALGTLAAVDATDGRTVWVYRYPRSVVAGARSGRLENRIDDTDRQSGFVNAPPLLVGDRCFAAPTDGSLLLALFDRPRGSWRELLSRSRDRWRFAAGLAVEQIVGVLPAEGARPAVLVVVGKGQGSEADPPAPLVSGLDPLTLADRGGWHGASPTGWGAESYGQAVLADDAVYVPTWNGIAVYDVADGRDVGLLDLEGVPPARRRLLPPDIVLSGNLVPVPGHGLLALNGRSLVYWSRAP
jgi:hypothetical protein